MADLNRRLRRARVMRTRESIYAEVSSKLESLSLLSVFEVDINEVAGSTSKHFEVALRFDEEAWHRRRRYDGFVLLVARPALMQSGVELVQLYRAKDAVEKAVREILERVAWEVIPDLAERLIREEIERLKAER